MTAQMIQSNANMTRALAGTQWKHKPGLLLCWTLLQASRGMKFNLERKQIGGTCTSQIRMQSALHCSLCRSGHLEASSSRHARVMRGSSSGDIASSQTINTAASVPTFSEIVAGWQWLGFRRTLADNYLVRPLSDPAWVLMVAACLCLYRSTHISHRNYLRLFLLHFKRNRTRQERCYKHLQLQDII